MEFFSSMGGKISGIWVLLEEERFEEEEIKHISNKLKQQYHSILISHLKWRGDTTSVKISYPRVF